MKQLLAALVLTLTLSTAAQAQTSLRDPFRLQPPGPHVPQRLALELTGVVQSGDSYYALVRLPGESRVLRLGDRIYGAEVAEISPGRLLLILPGEHRRLRAGDQEFSLDFRYAWSYALTRGN